MTNYGEIAFNAYCATVQNKTYDNKPIPDWDDLKEEIKQAWCNAANAAVTAYALEYVL